jgi:hypothetical protein
VEQKVPSQVTTLLQEWREGDSKALDALIPLVYKELRRLAPWSDPPWRCYCSFAYSALASFRMGTSGSASFQSARKSL